MGFKSTARLRKILLPVALWVSLSLACRAVSHLTSGAPTSAAGSATPSPTPWRTPSKTNTSTPLIKHTQTPWLTTAIAEPGPAITGTLTDTLTLMPSLDITTTLTATATLEPTPTVVVDLELMEKYTSPFPLPGEVENFSRFGDIKISYQTDRWMDEVISFYVGALSQQRLYEIEKLRQVTDDYFSLVFAGSLNGMLVFVEGRLDDEGWLHMQVYYGY